MSSHREAPGISKDPVADSTDLYAFVSPDKPGTVTLIANYVPAEEPAGGPNFFEFGDDVLYEIHIAGNERRDSGTVYQFRFTTTITNPDTFLYNTGPIRTLTDPHWNRRQTYSVTKVAGNRRTVLGSGIPCPPCNIGPRSTPDYASLAAAAITPLRTGETVFAGQRAEAFFVDLGSIFDLVDLRPIQNLHLIPTPAAAGIDTLKSVNVHSIAIQVPIGDLTHNGSVPTGQADPNAVIGVYTSASRQRVRIEGGFGQPAHTVGPFTQVSRLGNPLVNEVLVPMSRKDLFNSRPPSGDSEFAAGVDHPELARLLPVLYPNVFPNLQAYTKPRADLDAIFLTGIPAGVVNGFQNYTGPNKADLLRLNVAIPPTNSPKPLGILGGDLAGYPNGRRVTDDVVTIELRAIAGATIPLVDPSFTPDGAASRITDGSPQPADTVQAHFPYIGNPHDGYHTPPS